MKILLFSVIIFSLLICGCVQGSVDTISSNGVQNSQIYQIYYIEASKERTDITATFRVGGGSGTTLELAEPGKILYNGAAIPLSAPGNLIGTNYRVKGTDYRTFTKIYNAKHEFSFTDSEENSFVNSISLAPLEFSGKSPILLDENQTTILLSRVVTNDEVLTISVDSIIDDEIPASGNSVYLNPSRNAVIVTPNFWKSKNVKPKSEVILKVKKNGTITQGTPLGGSISVTYSAAPFYVSATKAKNAVNINTNSQNSAVKKDVTAANTVVSESKNRNFTLKGNIK